MSQSKRQLHRLRKAARNTFFVPSELQPILEGDLKKGLPERTYAHPEQTIRFLDLLIRKRLLSHLRDGEKYVKKGGKKPFYSDRWIDIPASVIQEYVGKNYRPVITELHKNGVIERSYFSREAKKSYGYRFTDAYKDSLLSCHRVRPKDFDRFDEKIGQMRKAEENYFVEMIEELRKHEEDNAPSWNPKGYLQTYRNLNSITLEYEENDLQVIEQSLKLEHSGLSYVHKINAVRFKCNEIIEGRTTRNVPFYSLDKYGRFHYFLTNLPKDLRPFVRMNGKRIVSYDITTSQCVFFALTVRDEVEGGVDLGEILEEIKEYYPKHLSRFENTRTESEMSNSQRSRMGIYRRREWCLNREIEILFDLLKDDFYGQIMKEIGWTKSRDDFKKDFFGFLYGPNSDWESPIIVRFQDKFPHIYLVLWKLKQLGDSRKRLKELRNQLYAKENRDFRKAIKEKLQKKGGTEAERKIAFHKEIGKAAMKQFKQEGKDKEKYYGQLPRRMQQRESKFIYQTIAPQIGRTFLTIHDSIIVEKTNRRNVKSIKKLLENGFKEIEVIVHIKEEEW